MERVRAVLTVGALMGLVGLLSTSCGSDEATGGEGGDPGSDGGEGGDGTSGGSTARGGGPSGGSGGSTTTTGGSSGVTSAVGDSCSADDDCGAGLECLTVETEGFPNGYCTPTDVCTTDADCEAIAPNTTCLTDFGICLEACELGTASIGEKCHGRTDLACTPLARLAGGSCVEDLDCGLDQICDGDGQCRGLMIACWPRCTGASDCPSDQFCDPFGGFCLDEEPMGDALGSDCDPEADECLGYCEAFVDDSEEIVTATCTNRCRLGAAGCGFEGNEESAPGACLFEAFTGSSTGDIGICAPLCDCDDDCLSSTHGCLGFADLGLPELAMELGRDGYCGYPLDQNGVRGPTLACGDGGAGGAGGASGGGSGGDGVGGDAGGEPGASGAPTDGGAPPDGGTGGTSDGGEPSAGGAGGEPSEGGSGGSGGVD